VRDANSLATENTAFGTEWCRCRGWMRFVAGRAAGRAAKSWPGNGLRLAPRPGGPIFRCKTHAFCTVDLRQRPGITGPAAIATRHNRGEFCAPPQAVGTQFTTEHTESTEPCARRDRWRRAIG